ncbi:MAG: phosphomannomutase/phosphoglucomutase [Aquisalimonadaceae bacterium]
MKRPRSRKDQADKERAPAARKAVSRHSSVYRAALLLFMLAAVVVLAAIGLSRLFTEQGQNEFLEREAGTAVSLLAANLRQAVDREQRQMAALAADRAFVSELVESGELPDSLKRAFPGAAGTMILPRGFSRIAPTANPPIGYALLEMLGAAERSGEAPPPELHRLSNDRTNVHFVQPLIVDGAAAAHLVVSYPERWLAQQLRLAPGGGYLVLEQRSGDGQLSPVLSSGQAAAPGVSGRQATVEGTPWRLGYVPAAHSPNAATFADPLLIGIAGGALLALGGVILLVFSTLRRRVGTDALAWQKMALDAARGELKPDYPVVLRELGIPMDAILPGLRDGTLMDAAEAEDAASSKAAGRGEGRAGGKKGRGRVTKSVGAPTEPNLKDLLTGLDVEEEMPKRKSGMPANTLEQGAVAVDRTLFRAYDIRGVVGKGLSVDVVRVIGRSIGSEAVDRGQTDIVVGQDGRLSSPDLADALMEGLRATGMNVIDIGRVPTPVMYFATHHLGTGSGVVVTGSHNPPDYNGLKIMLAGETLSGDAIAALHARIEREDFVDGEGSLRRQDVVPDYLARIVDDASLHRPLRVVVDCGNGVAGETAPDVLRAMGCEVEELYCDVDGTFPNHHPDPSDPANLQSLINAVRVQEADVGLAFDGDGDRLGVVDASGKIIWPDRQMMLYAMDILGREPGADIIFDVKCSAHLARIITENAGVPVMWRTGHSLIKAKLKESGAPLAGEMSGHIFFNDRWYGFDDGIYTAARLLEILSMDSRSSTEIFAELPETVSTPELKIHLEEGEPPELIRRLVGKASFPHTRVTTIDGLRVDFPDGWGLVRASNTTPCLVLRFEADDETALERIKQAFRDLLDTVRPGLDTSF